ncbi:hypothetical protein, partial [Pseudomonas brassicacearum]|uniref:hypothetical protein n=1 Tax=Pseudomonas brassicacearum TaxID=930166 RepID=UPI001C62E160
MIQAPRSLLAAWRIRSITFSQAKKKSGNPHFRGPSRLLKLQKMVGRVGFEPTTNWLKANCST